MTSQQIEKPNSAHKALVGIHRNGFCGSNQTPTSAGRNSARMLRSRNMCMEGVQGEAGTGQKVGMSGSGCYSVHAHTHTHTRC